MKTVIVIALLAVLGVLASAGYFLVRKGQSKTDRDTRLARALAWRVGLSISLFLFLLLSWRMGWIQPTGIPIGR